MNKAERIEMEAFKLNARRKRICGLLRNWGVVISPEHVGLELCADSDHLKALIVTLESSLEIIRHAQLADMDLE